jgi:hypothetical protein
MTASLPIPLSESQPLTQIGRGLFCLWRFAMKSLIAVAALTALIGCGSETTNYSTNEPNWDAARDAGYSEADIDAAKEYSSSSFENATSEEQEDRVLYNSLKQMGYSDSDANHAVESSKN